MFSVFGNSVVVGSCTLFKLDLFLLVVPQCWVLGDWIRISCLYLNTMIVWCAPNCCSRMRTLSLYLRSLISSSLTLNHWILCIEDSRVICCCALGLFCLHYWLLVENRMMEVCCCVSHFLFDWFLMNALWTQHF